VRPDGGTPPGPAGEPAAADPALARERTDLAWTRSSIAFFGLGAALLKFRPAIAIPVLAIGVAVWLIGHLPPRRTPAWLAARRELLVTATVTGLALVALALTLAGSSPGLRP
jgi:uncharacterized membrane protein YidH (DUF202 family)